MISIKTGFIKVISLFTNCHITNITMITPHPPTPLTRALPLETMRFYSVSSLWAERHYRNQAWLFHLGDATWCYSDLWTWLWGVSSGWAVCLKAGWPAIKPQRGCLDIASELSLGCTAQPHTAALPRNFSEVSEGIRLRPLSLNHSQDWCGKPAWSFMRRNQTNNINTGPTSSFSLISTVYRELNYKGKVA